MNGTYARAGHLIDDGRRNSVGHSNGLGIMMRLLRRTRKSVVATGIRPSDEQPVAQSPVRLVTSAPRPLYRSIVLASVTR